MGPVERIWRTFAARYRSATPVPDYPARLLRRRASECDQIADLEALAGLDLSDLFRPTAGDALALRGEGV